MYIIGDLKRGVNQLKIKLFFLEFIKVFLITLIIAILVTYLWNLIVNSSALVDWETSFRLSIIFGIVFGILNINEK
jgi:hypothetical protein